MKTCGFVITIDLLQIDLFSCLFSRIIRSLGGRILLSALTQFLVEILATGNSLSTD
jgi:hypothetical protein